MTKVDELYFQMSRAHMEYLIAESRLKAYLKTQSPARLDNILMEAKEQKKQSLINLIKSL